MSNIFKNILITLISLILLISIGIFAILWNFSNNIPDYKFLKNYKPSVSSKMYSGNGDLVANFSKEKPTNVEEYSEWRAYMSSMSEYCAQQAFDQFKKYNILQVKFKYINDMK